MTEIRDRADDAVSWFDWSRCMCVVVLDYTCYLGLEGAKYKFLSCDFDIRDDPATPRQRDRETERPGAGKDTWSQAGEEREVRRRRMMIPSLPNFSISIDRRGRSSEGMQSKGSRSG